MRLAFAVLIGLVTGVGALTVASALRDSVKEREMTWRRPKSRSSVDDRELVEALAIWIEQLRDTMAGARGLEQAIAATASTAPHLLQKSVTRLADRLDHEPLSNSARTFAEEVDNSLADFVVAVLVTASQQQVRDVGAVLSQLADCCRDEVRMRTRVWVSRARTRSAVRIIVGVLVVFVAGLFAFNRTYLEPYGSPSGMVVLALVVILFATALTAMNRLSKFDAPPRFVSHRGASS
ncbi:MAG: type II secretion system F family protein [Actinomycetota bacterium]|nr:type II secretion system F family protein [Actinomycetota bacterium]MDA2971648.1 type II secretion system F family protein [Actinomycetota bacterium]MDA3000228.1 type II secretion system F family protein [Actinomycetota bacterium]